MAETVYMEGIAKVQLFYGGDLHDIGVTTFYLFDESFAGATAETLAECAALIKVLWDTNIMPSVSSDVNCYECAVADWGSAEGLTGSALSTGTGGMDGDVLSAQVATLVNLAQPLRYRGGHPRWYIPYPAQSALTSPLSWSTDFLETMQTNLNTLLAGLNSLEEPSGTPTLVCFHTRDHVDDVLQPPSHQVVTALTVSPTPATIRRRIRRAGHRR
jgi:hypothetical protein